MGSAGGPVAGKPPGLPSCRTSGPREGGDPRNRSLRPPCKTTSNGTPGACGGAGGALEFGPFPKGNRGPGAAAPPQTSGAGRRLWVHGGIVGAAQGLEVNWRGRLKGAAGVCGPLGAVCWALLPEQQGCVDLYGNWGGCTGKMALLRAKDFK
ncbi:translation initiation factor IF-2-like [Penaeus monodon]|uniref:translation initiation factor IF-2-like n=1 Tax=Penaeus monodon TaxID=6687 RepID=UPI0018A7A453|nr:translation initiation factor IF-2-like [Penaeus monodon]